MAEWMRNTERMRVVTGREAGLGQIPTPKKQGGIGAAHMHRHICYIEVWLLGAL